MGAFRLGAFPQEAAGYAGISPSTLYRWRAAAHPQAHPELAELESELRRAEAQAELEACLTINRAAAKGEWRAAAWMLERLEPDQFGPLDRLGRRPTNPVPPEPAELPGLDRRPHQS